MEEKDLKRLLRAHRATDDVPGRRCPDETDLAAYVEHRLSAAQEARMESHLADCSACLEQAAFLARRPAVTPETVAPQMVTRAQNLVADRRVVWPAAALRWGALAATAVLVAVVLGRQALAPGFGQPGDPKGIQDLWTPSSAPPGPAPAQPAAAPSASRAPAQPGAVPQSAPAPVPPARHERSARNRTGSPLHLELQFPTENATLSPPELEFRWRQVPSATYYEVHLVTEDGTVVWQGRAEGTRARPPESVLAAGRKYFVWVRAYLSGGGTVKSPAVTFRIGGP